MDLYRLDTGESAFFKRQLEYIKTKTYDKKFKKLKAMMLLPVSTEAPAGADYITYRSFTKVGVAKIISDYANDFPRVDIYGEEKQAKVRSIGESYGYSVKEIRRAQMAGTNLNQRRADAARRANDELVEKIAWLGDSDSGLQGFINYPGITEYTVPNGAGGTQDWASKTPDEIVADVTGMVNAIVETTNEVEIPDTMLLPVKQYLHIANTRMTDGNDKTILTFILDNNPYLKQIETLTQLKAAGAGGDDRMMMYTKDMEHITLEIPQPFEQFTEQQKGMEFIVPCHSETGGVIIYYPLSVCFGDGI